MAKFNKLFNKVDMFEKLAVYGNKTDFLKSLAQDATSINPNDLSASIQNIRMAVQNWITNSAEGQSDLPSGQIKGLPSKLREPYNIVRSTNDFNINTLPTLYQALLNLSTVFNLGEMGSDAKNAWLHDVFPVLGIAMDKVKKQMDLLNNWSNQ